MSVPTTKIDVLFPLNLGLFPLNLGFRLTALQQVRLFRRR